MKSESAKQKINCFIVSNKWEMLLAIEFPDVSLMKFFCVGGKKSMCEHQLYGPNWKGIIRIDECFKKVEVHGCVRPHEQKGLWIVCLGWRKKWQKAVAGSLK